MNNITKVNQLLTHISAAGSIYNDYAVALAHVVAELETRNHVAPQVTVDVSASGLIQLWKQAEEQATDTVPAPIQFARLLLVPSVVK